MRAANNHVAAATKQRLENAIPDVEADARPRIHCPESEKVFVVDEPTAAFEARFAGVEMPAGRHFDLLARLRFPIAPKVHRWDAEEVLADGVQSVDRATGVGG